MKCNPEGIQAPFKEGNKKKRPFRTLSMNRDAKNSIR